MKNLFIKLSPIIFLLTVATSFFLPQLIQRKLPISADALVGLYHPWRDLELNGYNSGKYPVKNPLVTDPVLQTYPWRKIAVDNIKKLQFPLWNPYSFSGQPLAANIQSAPFNPLNVIFLLFNFDFAWTINIVLGSVLTSIFMFIFLRSLNLNVRSSLYGAIILPFTGFYVAWLTWGTVHVAASFLPLMLFAINKMSIKLSHVYFLLLTVSIVIVIFAGHTQTSLYVLSASILYVIYKAYSEKNWKIILFSALSFFTALLITMPQTYPAVEFFKESNRVADLGYVQEKEDWFIPAKHVIQLIVPDYFGNPVRNNYWGVWNYGEFVSFIGIIPIIFSLFAITRMNKNTIFFVFLTGLAVLFAFKNPISELPYLIKMPIISSMQPSRIIFLLDFSLVVLAAIGIDAFINRKFPKTFYKFIVLVAFMLVSVLVYTLVFGKNFKSSGEFIPQMVALRNIIIPLVTVVVFATIVAITELFRLKAYIFIIVFLTILELFYFAYKFTPFSPQGIVFPQTSITNYLTSQQKPFRTMSTDRRIANPNSLAPYKIESVGGYDPLYLQKYATLLHTWQSGEATEAQVSLNRFATPENYKSNITNLMNVKYVLTFDDIDEHRFEKIMEEGKTKLYRNLDANERVFFAPEVTKLESGQLVLEAMANPTNKNVSFSRDFEFKNGDHNAQATIVDYLDNSMKIRTQSDKPTPLIISNMNYPGWHATIDGEKSPILDANYTMQSIIVPGGNHIVSLVYLPWTFVFGLYASLTGLVLLSSTSVYLWRRSR